MSQITIPYLSADPKETEHLSEWLFNVVSPHLKGRILELNSSKGYISSLLVDNGYTIELNASSEIHRDFLKEKFKAQTLVRGVHKISLQNPSMELKYRKFQNNYSTVLAIGDFSDVVAFDKSILTKAMRFLEPEGHLIVVDKASIDVFPGSEPDLTEIKEYHRPELRNLFAKCKIEKTGYFDCNGLRYIALAKNDQAQPTF